MKYIILMQTATSTTGVEVKEREPVIHYGLASRPPAQTLREAGNMCYQKNGGGGPDLIVAVLPEASADLYMRIKQ